MDFTSIYQAYLRLSGKKNFCELYIVAGLANNEKTNTARKRSFLRAVNTELYVEVNKYIHNLSYQWRFENTSLEVSYVGRDTKENTQGDEQRGFERILVEAQEKI